MDEESSEAARELGLRGAAKGGRARAERLKPAERSEIARKAVQARWIKAGKTQPTADAAGKVLPSAAAAEVEMPYSMFRGTLDVGDVTFECHVLNDGRRVLTQTEVVRVLTGGTEGRNLSRYLERNPLFDETLLEQKTIHFRIPPGVAARGYEATLLIEICESYLDARSAGLLKRGQGRIAQMAEIVVRSCAKVGIIALVDEATGYQQIRAKKALQFKLQAFIADEMQEWAVMFPDDFWFELARLEGVRYQPRSRPLRWGKYIMMFVYDAVDPDVGKELRKINPDPHFKKNHHQWLRDHGREKVNNQVQQVIAVMKLCKDMDDFRRKFAKVFQKTPLQLSIDDIDWPD